MSGKVASGEQACCVGCLRVVLSEGALMTELDSEMPSAEAAAVEETLGRSLGGGGEKGKEANLFVLLSTAEGPPCCAPTAEGAKEVGRPCGEEEALPTVGEAQTPFPAFALPYVEHPA